MLDAMALKHGNSFTGFAAQCSADVQQSLLALPWSDQDQATFEQMARNSWEAQKALEVADTLSFEEWRLVYMSAENLG